MTSPLHEKMSTELRRVSEQLEALSVSNTVRIPEQLFVQVFLPFFAGEPNTVSVAEWIGVAGSPFRTVDVIKDGQVLFTVPPMFDRRAVRPDLQQGTPVAHIVRSVEQYNGISPIQGRKYMDAELAKKAMVMESPVDLYAYATTWNQIFARYGYPVLAVTAPETPSHESTDKGDDVPEFDYAPL